MLDGVTYSSSRGDRATVCKKMDCRQPSIFSYFSSIVERGEESRKNWTSAQNGRREGVLGLVLAFALKK